MIIEYVRAYTYKKIPALSAVFGGAAIGYGVYNLAKWDVGVSSLSASIAAVAIYYNLKAEQLHHS